MYRGHWWLGKCSSSILKQNLCEKGFPGLHQNAHIWCQGSLVNLILNILWQQLNYHGCCNIFFLINGGVHWVKRYYKNVLESYHCPRQYLNLQFPAPKSCALSIGPQGLFGILILNIFVQYQEYFNQAWNSGFIISWKTNIFDECGAMTSV